jgi:hypothetical protein
MDMLELEFLKQKAMDQQELLSVQGQIIVNLEKQVAAFEKLVKEQAEQIQTLKDLKEEYSKIYGVFEARYGYYAGL